MNAVGPWMDPETAARELGLPVEVVRDAVRSGQLPGLTIDEHVRISREALYEMATGRLARVTVRHRAREAMMEAADSDPGLRQAQAPSPFPGS